MTTAVSADGDDLAGLIPELLIQIRWRHTIRYAMSASLKLTRSGRRSHCSIARASDTWSQRRSGNTKRAVVLSTVCSRRWRWAESPTSISGRNQAYCKGVVSSWALGPGSFSNFSRNGRLVWYKWLPAYIIARNKQTNARQGVQNQQNFWNGSICSESQATVNGLCKL